MVLVNGGGRGSAKDYMTGVLLVMNVSVCLYACNTKRRDTFSTGAENDEWNY